MQGRDLLHQFLTCQVCYSLSDMTLQVNEFLKKSPVFMLALVFKQFLQMDAIKGDGNIHINQKTFSLLLLI